LHTCIHTLYMNTNKFLTRHVNSQANLERCDGAKNSYE